ncbi:MAG: hypothetical protein J0L66_13560 [Cytophagales bacterium]|nr:hypothetical protein [Cytophagales bacterium]
MRVIRFLFALYVLALSAYPCSDKETCMDERKAGMAFISVTDHDHTSREIDQCTPFCICACCAAHVQLTSRANQEFSIFAHNTKQRSSYFERSVSNIGHSIWQPPKI